MAEILGCPRGTVKSRCTTRWRASSSSRDAGRAGATAGLHAHDERLRRRPRRARCSAAPRPTTTRTSRPARVRRSRPPRSARSRRASPPHRVAAPSPGARGARARGRRSRSLAARRRHAGARGARGRRRRGAPAAAARSCWSTLGAAAPSTTGSDRLLPRPLSFYLVVNYAAVLALLGALTYGAIPLLAERQARGASRGSPWLTRRPNVAPTAPRRSAPRRSSAATAAASSSGTGA